MDGRIVEVRVYDDDLSLLRELVPDTREVRERLHDALTTLAHYEDQIAHGKMGTLTDKERKARCR